MNSRPIWKPVLIASIAVNLLIGGWLVMRVRVGPALPDAELARLTPPDSNASPGVLAVAGMPEEAPLLTWAGIASTDLEAYDANLRAMKVPDRVVRTILEAELRWAYLPRLREVFREHSGDFWAKVVHGKTRREPPKTPAQQKATQELERLLTELGTAIKRFGTSERGSRRRDRYPGKDGSETRWDHLSEPSLQLVRDQAKAEADLRRELSESGSVPSDEINRQIEALRAAQAREREATFSKEELEEHALRHSRYASFTRGLYDFDPTPEERRAIIELNEKFAGKVPEEEWSQVFGGERGEAFERARDEEFALLSKVSVRMDLPDETAVRSYEINRQAEAAAAEIRSRLSPEESEEALNQIRLETEKELVDTLGQEALDLYQKQGGRWLRSLK